MFDDHETERTFLRKFIQPDERTADIGPLQIAFGNHPLTREARRWLA